MLWKFVSRHFEGWFLGFRWNIWGFTMKKLKLGKDPPCRRTPKKNFKASNWSTNQLSNHDDWSQFHLCTIISIEINRCASFFFFFFFLFFLFWLTVHRYIYHRRRYNILKYLVFVRDKPNEVSYYYLFLCK